LSQRLPQIWFTLLHSITFYLSPIFRIFKQLFQMILSKLLKNIGWKIWFSWLWAIITICSLFSYKFFDLPFVSRDSLVLVTFTCRRFSTVSTMGGTFLLIFLCTCENLLGIILHNCSRNSSIIGTPVSKINTLSSNFFANYWIKWFCRIVGEFSQ